MCTYVEATTVLPGWGCCRCHTYNGLQREVCRGCGSPPHAGVVVPPEVLRCSCGFGCRLEDARRLLGNKCPVCGEAFPVIAPLAAGVH